MFFGKRKKKHKTSHILKLKTPLEKEPHFENGNQKGTKFWKWKHLLKKNHILRMEAHSEMYFENENMLLGKWKESNPFFFKLQLANSIKKGSRIFVGAKIYWLIISNPEFFPSES